MLTPYLISLLVGGVLVGASVFLGGDADADADADLDADADADGGDHEHAHGGLGDGLSAWLPYGSLRFWTFFLAFGGLIGTLLTLLDLGTPIVVAIASLAVGYASGLGIAKLIRSLQTNDVSSAVQESDYLGASGTVLLPVARGRIGQVRVQIKGRDIDLTAITEDDDDLASSEQVLVYDVRDDGVLVVTSHQNPTRKQRRAS